MRGLLICGIGLVCLGILHASAHAAAASETTSSPATTEIANDEAPPAGIFTFAGYPIKNTASIVITLLPAPGADVAYAEVSNDGISWTPTEAGWSVPWTLAGPDGDKTIHARWVGSNGATSPVVTLDLVLDRVAPTISTPSRPSFVVPQTTTATTVAERFAWASSDDRSGVDGHEVERSVDGGPWTQVSSYAHSPMTVAVPFNRSVRYRVRAFDKAGNTSGWGYTPTIANARVQNTSAKLTWRGTWITNSSSLFLGGSSRWARAHGSSVSYRFTGRSIAWVTAKFGTSAKAKIYIDGAYVKTVSLNTTGHGQYRRILFVKSWPTSGTHTIKIVSVNAYGGTRVDIDAFIRQ